MKKNNTKAIELLKDLIERVRNAKFYPPKAFLEDLIQIYKLFKG